MSYHRKFQNAWATLFKSYVEHTGAMKTETSQVIAGYPSFYHSVPRGDIGGKKFDTILARFSAIWPADLPWPDGIERPAPSTDDDIVIPRVRARAPANSPLSDWPADQPWPADIPRPVGSPEQDVSGKGA